VSWSAQINISNADNGFRHVHGMTTGSSAEEALHGAEVIFELICPKDREAFIRAAPEVASETDFATKETFHRGFVRFTVCPDKEGQRHYPEPNDGTIRFASMAASGT